jgi:hypothetical protein
VVDVDGSVEGAVVDSDGRSVVVGTSGASDVVVTLADVSGVLVVATTGRVTVGGGAGMGQGSLARLVGVTATQPAMIAPMMRYFITCSSSVGCIQTSSCAGRGRCR